MRSWLLALPPSTFALIAILAACSGSRQPRPDLPPPVYEPARSLDITPPAPPPAAEAEPVQAPVPPASSASSPLPTMDAGPSR